MTPTKYLLYVHFWIFLVKKSWFQKGERGSFVFVFVNAFIFVFVVFLFAIVLLNYTCPN